MSDYSQQLPTPQPRTDFFAGSRPPGSKLTLQKTFVAEGDIIRTGLDSVIMRFSYPDTEFESIPATHAEGGNVTVKRNTGPLQYVDVRQDLAAKEYYAELPPTAIGGGKPMSALNYLTYVTEGVLNSATIDHVSFPVSVSFLSEEDGPIGTARSFSVIPYFKNYYAANFDGPPILQGLSGGGDSANSVAAEFIARNGLFINAEAFNELMVRVTALRLPLEFLPTIAFLTDLSTGVPTLHQNLSDEDRAAVMQLLENAQVYGDKETALALIVSYFDRLYDFPISTAGVKLQQVAGILTITGADEDVTLTPADFALYDLSLDYEALNEDGELELREIHYDWSALAAEVVDNGMQFSLSDGRLIAPGEPGEVMTVTVRSLDGMVLWNKEFRAGASALEHIHISVPLQGTGAVKPNERGRVNPLRLRGQILDMTKTATLTGALVLIEAKGPKDTAWRIVGSASADKDGYFSLPYPFGNYTHAQALVSLNVHAPVPISVHEATADGQTICEDFLFLMLREIKAPIADGKGPADDCDCHDKVKATRLPDHADLIHSDEYSQDLGAGCLSLSTPNRTLREYSYTAVVRTSDPDVANYTLVKDDANAGTYMLQGDGKKRKRKAIDLTNPIRWQDAPDMPDVANGLGHTNASFYQAVTVATGHVLHYKSQFKADGYSLGELIYSLPLAPGQKKQIVVFDSSHNLQGAESQNLSVSERLANSLVNDRDISDQLGGSISEGLRGSSSATTAGVSVAAGASGSTGAFGASLGVAGGWSNSNSDASQDSSRNISQFFSEKLRNGLMQNADSYRQQNASVVTTVTEGQKYAATTEVVANHNHCHSLTMMYFEVLKHYAIYQELSNVEECVFVPLLLTNFTKENVFKWRDVLAANLQPLASNTYLPALNGQHPLARAFDATERVLAKWMNVDFPLNSFAEDTVQSITGTLDILVNLPRPRTRYDRIMSFPPPEPKKDVSFWDVFTNIILAPFTGGWPVAGYDTNSNDARTKLADKFMKIDSNYESVPPAQCIRIINFGEVDAADALTGISGVTPDWNVGKKISGSQFFDGNDLDKQAWEAFAAILNHNSVTDMLTHYFQNQLIADWDTIYYNDIVPALFDKIVKSLTFSGQNATGGAMDGFKAELTATQRYTRGQMNISVNVNGTTTYTRATMPPRLVLTGGPALKHLKSLITLRLQNLSLTYSTPHFTGPLYQGYLGQDIQDEVLLFIPLTSADKRNPRAEDVFIVTRLLDHLNSNLEYYNKVLWYNLDTDRRYNLLDGFNIQVYNDHGVPIGLKSIASVIKNELVTVAGNSLVFPVASGFRVSRSYLVEQTETGGTEKAGLLEHYKPLTPPPPFRLSVPTRGLFVEAVKGLCDSCEAVEDNTSQDWDKFKADEPTGINALTAPTPEVTDWKATFKDIASATLRLQDAPAEPAPGAGLAGLSTALTNGNAFRDVTGLAKNQDNAVATYKANTDAAVKMAESAKSLATQEHNTAKGAQITQAIKDAVSSGAISKEDGSKFTKQHIAQLLDGGETARAEVKAEAAKEKAAGAKVLTTTVADSASKGRGVQVQETDSDGNARSIKIDPATATDGKTGSVLASVTGEVAPIAVPSDKKLGAWAVCAAMMMNWKDGKKLDVPERMAALGADFANYYDAGKGLPSKSRASLLAAMKAVAEADTFTLKQYMDLMGAYGPLWIATDYKDDKAEFCNVGFILTKIEDTEGDSADATLSCIEPYSGKASTMLCSEFVSKMKDYVVADDTVLIRIIHFADKQGGDGDVVKDAGGTSATILDSGTELTHSHGAVPLIKQPDDVSCWAASAAMMVSWQIGYPDDVNPEKVAAMDIDDVVRRAGQEFVVMFTGAEGKDPTGLHMEDKDRFLTGLDMVSEEPTNFMLSAYIDMLNDYGPLWFTMDALTGSARFAPHARVLTKITGDKTVHGTYFHFNDPIDDTKEHSMPFLDFIKGYEQIVTDTRTTLPFQQLVHFRDKQSWLKRKDWNGEIKEATDAIAADKAGAKALGFPVKDDDLAEGFKIGGPMNIRHTVPAHETLTLAAFRNSTFGKSLPPDAKVTWDSRHTQGANKEVNEFFRGVVWNDDPACLLFKDDPKHKTDNFVYSTGAAWLKKFETGALFSDDRSSVTGRSHYGDLQFVHAMASNAGEPARETQAKIMMWAELTYKLALNTDPALGNTRLDALPMEFDNGKGIMMLKDLFSPGTDPKDSDSVRYLFLRNTNYLNPDLSRRALGSLLHMIQDSFAIGHTKRELMNKKDMAPEPPLMPYYGNDRFLDWGPVITFHTYKGQGDEHGEWDYAGTNGMDDNDLTSLNRIPGGRNAVEHSKIIINFWDAKTPWEDGPGKYLLEKVFVLSGDATAANGEVG